MTFDHQHVTAAVVVGHHHEQWVAEFRFRFKCGRYQATTLPLTTNSKHLPSRKQALADAAGRFRCAARSAVQDWELSKSQRAALDALIAWAQQMVGDFLEPNDQDEDIKHWNNKERETRSELPDPLDRDWYESQIAPVLNALARKIEREGRGASLSTIRSKAQLAFQLTSLDELASEMAATVSALRGEFAKRHETVTTTSSGR